MRSGPILPRTRLMGLYSLLLLLSFWMAVVLDLWKVVTFSTRAAALALANQRWHRGIGRISEQYFNYKRKMDSYGLLSGYASWMNSSKKKHPVFRTAGAEKAQSSTWRQQSNPINIQQEANST
ncbi:hypothetical protein J3E72DRAFT_273466 [Bipolaris maydis]|nr:hypothetical protein J3E72DRAFT_273466 [Bipolaris maydis]